MESNNFFCSSNKQSYKSKSIISIEIICVYTSMTTVAVYVRQLYYYYYYFYFN